MLRSLLFTGALLAAGAACAQEVAISGKDFLSGAGDAKIAELARQAAASGKTLVVSAPPYWQDKAASKVRAGAANASVRMSDAFFENVMVRVEDTKVAAKPVEAPVAKAPKPEPRPEPKVVEAKPVAPAPKPAPVEAPVAARPTPVTTPPPVKTEVAPAPVVAPPPAPVAASRPPAPAPAPAVAAKAATDPTAEIKQRLAQHLNGGQPAEGNLQTSQLQKDDLVFVDGPVRAVVRRFGPRTQLYWLQGDLNVARVELAPTGNDRYRVTEPLRANVTLRPSSKTSTLKFTFNVPAPKTPARLAIERQYNDGHDIDTTLQPSELRQGDLVYTGEGSAVVVRRTATGIERYWLVGELDVHQGGLQTQGNAIRVLTDTIK
ncbi:MAG TPA: hypothetical protein VGH81_12155 [Rudaea sp.]|jgi:outer membrane biosynthesis protein TonB